MTQSFDLEKLERSAFRTSFQDGMTDVMLGSFNRFLRQHPVPSMKMTYDHPDSE